MRIVKIKEKKKSSVSQLREEASLECYSVVIGGHICREKNISEDRAISPKVGVKIHRKQWPRNYCQGKVKNFVLGIHFYRERGPNQDTFPGARGRRTKCLPRGIPELQKSAPATCLLFFPFLNGKVTYNYPILFSLCRWGTDNVCFYSLFSLVHDCKRNTSKE